MVTLRTSSVDMDDHSGGRARKMPRGAPPPDAGMGMPPLAINTGPPRGRLGPPPPPMGVGPPLPPPGPGGGPRTTATSRRGGRTRARSPLVAANGGAGNNVGGRRPGSAEPRPGSANGGDRRGMVHGGKGDNPSSAAAAAAAAAKAFSDNNHGVGRNNQWPENRHHDDRGGYPHMGPSGPYSSKDPYGRGGGGSSKKWPPNPHDDQKMSGHYSHTTYGPYGGGGAGGGYDGYGAHGYGDRRYRGSGDRQGSLPHHQYKDMRGPEGGHRGGRPDAGRGPMYHHHGDYHHRTYLGGGSRSSGGRGGPPPHPQPPPGEGAQSGGSTKTSRSSNNGNGGGNAGGPAGGGGTSLVIGGTTPIHVPKPEVHHPELSERPTSAITRSVFRNPDSTSVPNRNEHPDENGQQKMILSMKTPSTSFEEKKSDDSKRPASSGLPLSPKDPPQLHSTSQQQTSDVFERSPEGNMNAPAIDLNASFNLLNQSFDSLGENYLPIESTLNSDSFGLPTGSTGGEPEGMTNVLRSALSGGNVSSTQLLNPSGSGHLTIGYSPVNSWGTAAPPRRDGSGGNMMLLGGPETRSSSPTQVLSSYNQGLGGNRGGPLDDSHLRMSVGSFGAQSYGRPAQYGDPSSEAYNGSAPGPPEKHGNGMHFYVFLKRYRTAFSGCSFLLPGLKAALLESSNDKNSGEGDSPDEMKPAPGYPQVGEPTPHDLIMARRRVESSVCAFGGSSGIETSPTPSEAGSSSNSIFREKSSTDEATATVTPSSSVASPPRSSSNAKIKTRYEEELPGRYYENDSRLSWEFEENPPVEVSQSSESKSLKHNQDKRQVARSSDDASTSSKRLGASSPPASKMRYRCKLCGQPKQNHICPYQQSLARSIGVMVYPAVNAFTAAEPGSIAPALSEMNNFTDLSDKGSVTNDSSPGRSGIPLTSPKQVTPESARASPRQLHLTSPPTTPGRTPSRSNADAVRRGGPSRGQKRPYEGRVPDDQGDLLFVDAMELKPQQFLSVSETPESSSNAFSYLPLPLPYAQRKRLSDNLFSLSNEVPKLTDECAQVLREAREKDKWDLAVAELITQVITVLHCRDGDHRFDGLRQYLLTLGIAC